MVLSVLLLVSIALSVHGQTLPTSIPQSTPPSRDHFLSVLQAIHHSDVFKRLPPKEQVFLVELIGAAETDTVTHMIDQVGFQKVLVFLDHVTQLNIKEAHLLEEYLIAELQAEIPAIIGKKRDLTQLLMKVQQNPAVQQLPQADKDLLFELLRAAENNAVTPLVHRTGYSRIIKLVEDIGTQVETHTFISYLVQHMQTEAKLLSGSPGSN